MSPHNGSSIPPEVFEKTLLLLESLIPIVERKHVSQQVHAVWNGRERLLAEAGGDQPGVARLLEQGIPPAVAFLGESRGRELVRSLGPERRLELGFDPIRFTPEYRELQRHAWWKVHLASRHAAPVPA